MKLPPTLDARIRSVRESIRAAQPLDHRIDLVRELCKAAEKKTSGKAPARSERPR